MIKKFIEFFYDFAYPKPEHKAVFPYRFEFLFEQTKINLEHLWGLMLISNFVQIGILFFDFAYKTKLAIVFFLIVNAFCLMIVYNFRKRNYGVRYKSMLRVQSLILINFIFLTSIYNLFEADRLVLVHLFIVFFVFASVILHIKSDTLAWLAIISQIFNIIGVLYYHTDPLVVRFEIMNIVIFIALAWYLGILSNRNRIIIWMNYHNQKEANIQLEELAQKDSMTQFYNHEKIFQLLDNSIEKAKLNKENLSILILDLDDFKNVNDTYGHQYGDTVLIEVSKTIRQQVRNNDLIGRYGGEEFMIIFPETTHNQAYEIAERIRLAVQNIEFKDFKITISGGISESNNHSSKDLIKLADKNLYAAKHSGKNQIRLNI